MRSRAHIRLLERIVRRRRSVIGMVLALILGLGVGIAIGYALRSAAPARWPVAGPPTVVVAQVVTVRPGLGRSCGIHFDYLPLRDRPADNRIRWHVDNQTGRALYVSIDYDGQVVAGPALTSGSANLDFSIGSGNMYSLLVTADRGLTDQQCIQLAAAPTGTDHMGWG